MKTTKISFPACGEINTTTLESVEIVGMHPDASSQSPVVYSITLAPEEFSSLEAYHIEEEQLAKIDRLLFKYKYKDKTISAWWFKQALARNEAKAKIAVPSHAKKNCLSSATLVVELKTSESSQKFSFDLQASGKVGYVEIPLSQFLACEELLLTSELKNGELEIITYKDKRKAIYKPVQGKLMHFECARVNGNTCYENSEDGRYACLAALDEKIANTHSLVAQVNGDGNLLYYCVYFSSGYVELFNNSLLSVLKESPAVFDVLVITDQATKKSIEATEASKKINLKYMLTDTPADGVEASKNKLKIFEFDRIFDYSKVLFLDCDTIAVGDVSALFNIELSSDLFYGVKPDYVNFWHIKSPHHGFKTLSDDVVEEMRLAKQYTFNAGQFMLSPSIKMQEHFANINWLMKNWPSEYFFEQCFMGYYFCKAYISEVETVTPFFNLLNVTSDIPAMSESGRERIFHFTAPPLDAEAKLTAIKKFTEGLKPRTIKLTLKDKVLNLFK